MEISKLIDAATRLQTGLVAKATNGEYLDNDYQEDLKILLTDKHIEKLLPLIVRNSRTTLDFRGAMQAKFQHYRDRREYIGSELRPLFEYLESRRDGTDAFSINVSDYDLGDNIGNGGYGTVYKYHHKLLDMDFAIKIFDPVFVSNEENLEGEKRFFREAKILFSLNHNNIVRVYDIGRIEGRPFIRMELVDGYNLQAFVEKFGTVSYERSLKPIRAILTGLCYAHSLGIVHRDLKPTNVMVTHGGEFKIIDFGVSAFIDYDKHTKLTKAGESVVGGPFCDPALMVSPKLHDFRSDIYSVGAIWYYLLLGCAPTGGDAKQKLVDSKKATNLQAEIILQCIASDIDNRFASCEQILSMITPSSQDAVRGDLPIINGRRITEVTRDSIFQYLIERHDEEENAFVFSQSVGFRHPEFVFEYNGRKTVIEFLKSLYDFDSIPSRESSFEIELNKHTISNKEYRYGWVFFDERLGLKDGDDEILLKFLCKMFHPLVRSEYSEWRDVLNHINDLIIVDGYEIFESEQISNKAVYGYRFHI